jgi:hypothetical protein
LKHYEIRVVLQAFPRTQGGLNHRKLEKSLFWRGFLVFGRPHCTGKPYTSKPCKQRPNQSGAPARLRCGGAAGGDLTVEAQRYGTATRQVYHHP